MPRGQNGKLLTIGGFIDASTGAGTLEHVHVSCDTMYAVAAVLGDGTNAILVVGMRGVLSEKGSVVLVDYSDEDGVAVICDGGRSSVRVRCACVVAVDHPKLQREQHPAGR